MDIEQEQIFRTILSCARTDVRRILADPPRTADKLREGMEDLLKDLENLDSILGKRKRPARPQQKPAAVAVEYPPSTEVLGSSHVINAHQLPSEVTVSGMRAALTVLSDEFGLANLKYINYSKGKEGTFFFNIYGKCPFHKRVHDGQAWKWQMQQHPKQSYSGLKCWRDNSYRKFSMLPLF